MLGKRLIIIGGKGGVGRTTVACALALALAKRGRRVLLTHVRCERCEDQLKRLLDTDRVDEKIRAVGDNLWVTNMNPRAAIREMGVLILRFRAVSRAVLENRIVRSLIRALPAIDDYSMIGKAWYHTTETDAAGQPRFDTVIFDGPATGHLISMLRIPQVILDTVPKGPLTTDARDVRALLTDAKRTAMLIVTLAEEMPASEGIDLYRAATGDLAIAVKALIVNQLYPDDATRDPQVDAAIGDLAMTTAGTSDELGSAVRAAETLRRRRRNNEHYLAHLTQTIPNPYQLHLAKQFTPSLDRPALQPIIDALTPLLGEPAR
ncbi:MAG: AAA family ATPase [Deltaproteobacteria bacterium]|nr:AAA family ATPase [Deltaproteobacteria bacterium]